MHAVRGRRPAIAHIYLEWEVEFEGDRQSLRLSKVAQGCNSPQRLLTERREKVQNDSCEMNRPTPKVSQKRDTELSVAFVDQIIEKWLLWLFFRQLLLVEAGWFVGSRGLLEVYVNNVLSYMKSNVNSVDQLIQEHGDSWIYEMKSWNSH